MCTPTQGVWQPLAVCPSGVPQQRAPPILYRVMTPPNEHTSEKELRLRADKLPSPNHCARRDFLLVFKNLRNCKILSFELKKHAREQGSRPQMTCEC